MRAGAKRAVFADVSNTARVHNVTDDNAKAQDNVKGVTMHVQEPAILLKPAQKPLSVKTLVSDVTTTTVPTKPAASVTAAAQTQPAAVRKVQSKKCATVLRDVDINSVDTEETETEPSSEATTDEAVAAVDADSTTEDPIDAAGPVQPIEKPVAAVVDAHIVAQLDTADAEERAVAVTLGQSLISNEGEYDEEEDDEEEFYDSANTVLKGDNTTGGATVVLAPRYTSKVHKELAEAKLVVESTRTAEDIEDEQWDTSMVAEYGEEIFEYMRTLEERMRPNPHYMDYQNECQWSMRAVLMDWLVQVHGRFTLLPETLFLAVNYIDRFLSCKVISLGKLQLVGATAIFLAAKYEEVNCPSVQEVVYMVDHGYTSDEILKAERYMLSMLHFELGWPGPMSFLRRISKADDYDLETRTLAKYFLEITIMDERFVGCTPSFLAAGAHCLARLMLRKGDWTQAHVYYSNYTYSQIRQLLAVMVECCETPDVHHAAVYNKYTDRRFKRASLFVQNEIKKGFKLPAFKRGSSIGYKGW